MADNSQILQNVLERTAPELARTINAQWWATDQYRMRGARVDKYRRYMRGDHDAKMTANMKKALRVNANSADRLNEFNGNYTGLVIDKESSRLSLSHMTTGTEAGDVWLNDIKRRSKFDLIEGATYRGSLRDGDAYIIIDPQTLTWKSNPAYNGFDGVAVIYNTDNNIEWACKLWAETSGENVTGTGEEEQETNITMHITVYQPDRITRWLSTGQGDLRVDPNHPEESWLASAIPVIPFVNKRDNDTMYGNSEIKDVIPLQDIYNRVLTSNVMIAELNGFKVFIVLNAKLDLSDGIMPGDVISVYARDGSGNPILNPTQEQIEMMRSISITELSPTDMTQYIALKDSIVREISYISNTPIYGITAQGTISGDALKQLEIGLIGKTKRFQKENTDSWVQLIALTHEIHQKYTPSSGQVSPPAIGEISVQWESPELRDSMAHVQTLIVLYEKTRGLFPMSFYRDQIGAALGLEQSSIDQLAEEVQQENMETMQNLLTAGGGEGGAVVI